MGAAVIDPNTTSFVSRVTWTDRLGVDWILQVRNGGDVEFIQRHDNGDVSQEFLMPKEAFVRLCPVMAKVIEGAYA